MSKLSNTLESYLDVIYELSSDGSGVRLTDIAKKMGVTKSTANAAMVSLSERNLISNERYGNIRLTRTGIEVSESITQKHEIVFRFFTEVLKLDLDTSNADACAIEHVISKNAVLAMQSLLIKQ